MSMNDEMENFHRLLFFVFFFVFSQRERTVAAMRRWTREATDWRIEAKSGALSTVLFQAVCSVV